MNMSTILMYYRKNIFCTASSKL